MNTEATPHIGKPLRAFQFIHLILLIVSNAWVLGTWYSIITSDADTMFLGLLEIALLGFTAYDLALLMWGFRLVMRSKASTENPLFKSMVLFLMTVCPVVLFAGFS